jgi:hypothetical protein
MLGTGEAGIDVLKAAAAQALAQRAQAAPPAARGTDPSLADTGKQVQADVPETSELDAQAADEQADDSKRFLVGDPMAPPEVTAKIARSTSRLSQDIPKERTGLFIAIGVVGVVVIAAIGYFVARMLGLA